MTETPQNSGSQNLDGDRATSPATAPDTAAPEATGEVVVVVGPDGRPVAVPAQTLEGVAQEAGEGTDNERSVADMVEQPGKVMRIGTMIKQLLDEVKAAPLDEASRNRLKDIHQASIKELESGLAPELVEELERLSLPFTEETPSEGELRIAQAQLVGWLEGLFHGIQTAIYAQQMAAQAQLESMRRGLPASADGAPMVPGQGMGGTGAGKSDAHETGGLYL